MAGLQQFYLEVQMMEQLSPALEAPGGLLKACCGGSGSALRSAGWLGSA